MAWTTVLSPAKINLFLELVSRRDDGFHNLDTVMAKVGLWDRLSFRIRNDDQIHLAQRDTAWPIPLDHRNLVRQAIQSLGKVSGKPIGLDVVIEKHIPVQAGLGGGSSNATTTLVTVNRLLDLKLSQHQLKEQANRLGSDLAFFFAPAAARCTGRGQRVVPLAGFRRVWAVIGMPPAGLDTGHVFRHAQMTECPADGQAFCALWQTAPLPALAGKLRNRLQSAASALSPWISRLRQEFDRVGCRGHLMSGSGTSYFGLFSHRRPALRAARQLQARLPQGHFFTVRTVRTGIDPRTRGSD